MALHASRHPKSFYDTMTPIDYIIVAAFMLGLLLLGLLLSKRAGKSSEEYILGGRKMPWWLAGTSLLATGLSASTMLQDARKIRQDGISGLWFTWRGLIHNFVASIWFNRLWRRARFTTQMEFYQARYSGWQATAARLYDSLIYGIIVASIWAATGIVGMKKIAAVLLDLPETFLFAGMEIPSSTAVIAILLVITLIYSAAAGVYGIVWTDFIEFIVAFVCSVILMVIVYSKIGWGSNLRENIESLGEQGENLLRFLPVFGPIMLFFFLDPFIHQGGYNPNTQRSLCVKNEREILYTSIYSAAVNFAVKPWPYYVCGLCGIFIISDAELLSMFSSVVGPDGVAIPDYEKVYPLLVERYLPTGLLGLMIAGFLSAFMSSFDSNIHNSASIFLNDLYRPYVAKNKSEKHYVFTTRLYMVFITIVAAMIGFYSDDILSLTFFAFSIVQSVGYIKLLRFIWWRVNGSAEIAAQICSLITAVIFFSPLGKQILDYMMEIIGQTGNDAFFVARQTALATGSTIVSIIAVLVFKPEPMDKLVAFYIRVRPFDWWEPVIREAGEEYRNKEPIPLLIVMTFSGIAAVLSLVFAAAGFFLAYYHVLAISLVTGLIGFSTFFYTVAKVYPNGGENPGLTEPTPGKAQQEQR